MRDYDGSIVGRYGDGGMMSGHAPGTAMGGLFADAPGARVSPAEADALGEQVPDQADVDPRARTVTITEPTVELAVLAAEDDTFRIAGLTDPTLVVNAGARITLTFVNADSDAAHGIVVSAGSPSFGAMPMMRALPAFSGAAVWFLGDATWQGMHEASVTFTADRPGRYHYLCPVPGHADRGMVGAFKVTSG